MALKSKLSRRQLKISVCVLSALIFILLLALTLSECAERNICVSVTQGGEITVTLPEGFTAVRDSAASNSGENISLYNVKGGGKNEKITGYLREAYITVPLDKYLEDSSEYKSAAIYDFSQSTITSDGRFGYVWRYKIKKDDGSSVSVRSAFFAGNNKFYTIQLSSDSENEKLLDAAFEKTIDALKFSDSVQSGKIFGWYNRFAFRKLLNCVQVYGIILQNSFYVQVMI